VYTKDGNFEFEDFKFKEPAFYSIQAEGSKTWLPFLIDTGHIFINAKKDSIYKGTITGSLENQINLLYRKKLLLPFSQMTQCDYDSMDKYRDSDTIKYNIYFKKIKKEESAFLLEKENFIKQHPSNYVSLLILKDAQREICEDSLRHYFNLLSPCLQNNSKAIELKYRITDFTKNTMPGSVVPNFLFKDIEGNEKNLYSIQAPFKLIVFWASWCTPCLAELPELKALHSRVKNLAIISFSIDDDKAAWIKSSKENEILWYSLSDSKGPEGRFAAYFGVQQIPLMVLLDGSNRIIKYNVEISKLKNYIESK
jgi:thiol-disulfide isomerase/thioredoxin